MALLDTKLGMYQMQGNPDSQSPEEMGMDEKEPLLLQAFTQHDPFKARPLTGWNNHCPCPICVSQCQLQQGVVPGWFPKVKNTARPTRGAQEAYGTKKGWDPGSRLLPHH